MVRQKFNIYKRSKLTTTYKTLNIMAANISGFTVPIPVINTVRTYVVQVDYLVHDVIKL